MKKCGMTDMLGECDKGHIWCCCKCSEPDREGCSCICIFVSKGVDGTCEDVAEVESCT